MAFYRIPVLKRGQFQHVGPRHKKEKHLDVDALPCRTSTESEFKKAV